MHIFLLCYSQAICYALCVSRSTQIDQIRNTCEMQIAGCARGSQHAVPFLTRTRMLVEGPVELNTWKPAREYRERTWCLTCQIGLPTSRTPHSSISPWHRENTFQKMNRFYCPGLSLFPGPDNKKVRFLCFLN